MNFSPQRGETQCESGQLKKCVKNKSSKQKDAWTDGEVDGQTDRATDGRTDWQTDRPSDGQTESGRGKWELNKIYEISAGNSFILCCQWFSFWFYFSCIFWAATPWRLPLFCCVFLIAEKFQCRRCCCRRRWAAGTANKTERRTACGRKGWQVPAVAAEREGEWWGEGQQQHGK